MASEMLDKILAVENKSAEAELFAKKQADDIIDIAKNTAAEIITAAHLNSQKSIEAYLNAARKQADEIMSVANDKAIDECEIVKTAAKQKQPDAVKAVLNYILPNPD